MTPIESTVIDLLSFVDSVDEEGFKGELGIVDEEDGFVSGISDADGLLVELDDELIVDDEGLIVVSFTVPDGAVTVIEPEFVDESVEEDAQDVAACVIFLLLFDHSGFKYIFYTIIIIS